MVFPYSYNTENAIHVVFLHAIKSSHILQFIIVA